MAHANPSRNRNPIPTPTPTPNQGAYRVITGDFVTEDAGVP